MSSVNFLQKLLDGVTVEWLPLGNLAEIYGGLTGKSKSDFEQGNANYITYKNIFSNIEINPDIFEKVKISPSEKQHKVQYGDILFTGSSEIANEAGISSVVTTNFDEEVYLNSFSFGVRFKSNVNITPEFSKYLFRCSFMRSEISRTASGVTRFNISKERFKKILIPVLCPDNPKKSLEIQAEIVRILDAMTAHTAELTAELTARKKQYNYYRDKLLSFEDGEVEWQRLIDACDYVDYRGKTPVKTEKGVFLVTAKNIRMGYIDYAASEEFVSKEDYSVVMRRGLPKNGDILITTEAPCGFVAQVDRENIALAQRVIKYRSKNKKLSNNFIKHYLISSHFQNKLMNAATGSTVKGIKGSKLHQLTIPIPSEDEQARIVTILDKFDALTTSITEGLPREIELRQKQYAYYRDLLLSFPQAQAA